MRASVVMAAAVLLVAACGGEDRPSDAAWAAEWEREQLIAPTPDEILDGGEDRCGALVGRFRELLPRLTPTPTEALDAAVEDWVDHLESLAFDCPDDPAEVDRRFEELAVLRAEIDAGIVADAG